MSHKLWTRENLARQIAVSFENETVRIVYASLKRGKLAVSKTLILKDKEFDDFLRKERHGHFTVVCDFKSFYQDIYFLPPVKEKYFRNIIETEIRKRSPDLKDFSFFYEVLGERVHEGKKVKEIFVFAVSSGDLSAIVDRFSKYGKRINSLYSTAFTMSRLVNLSCGISEDPVLCVTETEKNKTLFLIKDGRLYFIRSAQSFESGIYDIDVQSINMTVNYCRQSLRLMPSMICLIGTVCSSYKTAIDLLAPAVCMEISPEIITSREILMEFIVPVSALLPAKGMERGNLLPEGYRSLQRQKAILKSYTVFFIIFSVIGLLSLKMKFSEIADTKKKIAIVRMEIKQMEPVIVNYEQKKGEIDRLMPAVNLINAMNAAPDIRKALAVISSLKRTETRDVNIASIDIASEGGVLRIKIKGNIAARNFTHMQQVYQYITGMIKKTEGMELLSDKIDFKDYNFQIEVKYNKQ